MRKLPYLSYMLINMSNFISIILRQNEIQTVW